MVTVINLMFNGGRIPVMKEQSSCKDYLLLKYSEVKRELGKAETEYNRNRKSIKKREEFQWVAAQYHILQDILYDLHIEYDDEINV